MAAEYKVKQYLAYWFQAGKKLICPEFPQGYPLSLVFQGDRYSPEFEECWAYVRRPESGDCYLQGITQTIQALLTSEWEIVGCARCEMPVPMLDIGVNHNACPCSDLELWPNFELPRPRSPVNTKAHLMAIHTRLLAVSIAMAQTKEADRESTQQTNPPLGRPSHLPSCNHYLEDCSQPSSRNHP
ncbi:MAG: hypothetical protein VKJ64_10760 [Leptolyngbyaceae bacterium]|nr:hypothetical protein [Leptolyngbyaceae bacterium]